MLFSKLQRGAGWAALYASCGLHLYATTIVVGNPRQTGAGECDPFGCPALFGLTTYQQVYTSTAFPGPIEIQQLTFYDTQVRNGGLPAVGTYTLSFSYTTKTPGNLNLINPANNISGPSQTFFTGSLPAPIVVSSTSRILVFSTITPYSYNPAQGNLLLTVTVTGDSDKGSLLFLDNALTTAQTSYAYFGTSNGGNDYGGLVTGFTVVVPFTTLYSFKGSPDGANPYGTLIAGANGILYGTAYHGGKGKVGAVFQLTPPVVPGGKWAEAVLYSFPGGANGVNPVGGLAIDAAGNLYGTTEYGGTGHNGTVFSLTPPAATGGAWTHTVLYSFAGGSDAANPMCSLILDSNGNLYGTSYNGGVGYGTVFQLSPPIVAGSPWTESVLYSFSGAADGANPYGGVTMDASGNLYGTTTAGGAGGLGTVFELSPSGGTSLPWNETLLYSFAGGPDAATPIAGVLLLNGTLYGSTTAGGASGFGTVFQLTPPSSGSAWTESVLYSFSGANGDGDPYATPILGANGDLYGTTTGGGTTGFGTVYQLAPPATAGSPWTETVLYSFTAGTDGATPYGGLVSGANGTFTGAAIYGGSGAGDIFQVTLVP